ncbi:inactive serine protease PAMR1 [Genypterus blacodes]|uniref:inactive serine protease PAMR1 n=1 Tax=Genypterus blacodes TaxID=154954 RepID=UPI003F75EAFA
MPSSVDPKLYFFLFLCLCVTAWPHDFRSHTGDNCPSSEWSIMCRPCCEYHLIQCRCPSKGSKVGYTVPCCRNALDQCDPCIIHPGCSLFENCKTCHNGTWKANDDFFIRGKYCTECRQGWSGGDCKTCGGVIQRTQGHIALESYPTNARCEWIIQVQRGHTVDLSFAQLSLEPDHNCQYDYIEVRDGDNLRSSVIGRFCGDQLPPPVQSSSNVLHVLFTSDGYNNFDGFVFTFQESSGRYNHLCELPDRPVHGDFLSVYGVQGELVSVSYQCHPSFTLMGAQHRTCLPNATWSGTVPICVKACQEPKVSKLVRQRVLRPLQTLRQSPDRSLRVSSRHKVYDFLAPGFSPLPLDKLADRDDSSLDELPRGFHPVHTSIEYKCASPLYRPRGSTQRTCLKNGRWSGRHVSCAPVCGQFAAFSPHTLAGIHWPWHVAVFIRSPPDHSARTHRPHVLTLSDQQGASEESTFWYLACSGSLITQHSVVVAAHCVVEKGTQQPLHPGHVKVVVGMKYHRSRDKRKSQQHLRVSAILVHPDFYSALDSDVAVLKLLDRAKISERVLPVCLPTMQGGEVTVQEAYTARWMLANDQEEPSHYSHSSQTKLVELVNVSQCENKFGQTTVISDNVLCVIRKPSNPHSACPNVIPGITSAQAVFSSTQFALLDPEETLGASSISWQLLGLESFTHDERNCHKQTHTGQTQIANFRDWIVET